MEVAVITDYYEACNSLHRTGRGTVKTKDGRVYSGPLITTASKWDDPDEIGYIALQTCPGGGSIIYATEFQCLLEDGDEA